MNERHITAIGWAVAIGVFIVGAGCAFSLMPSTDRGDATHITRAKAIVKGRLRSPSTASFPWSFDEYDVSVAGGVGTVRGYVDAQNGFGATVRRRWKVSWEDNKVVDVSFY